MPIRTICENCQCTGRIKVKGRKRPAICPDCDGMGFKLVEENFYPRWYTIKEFLEDQSAGFLVGFSIASILISFLWAWVN